VTDTIFDKIIREEVPSWKVWENDHYLAFLTPFASTPGITIVIPKINPGHYIFEIDSKEYLDLMSAARTVAGYLKEAFDTNIAMVFEGNEVPYVHAKLYPMHNLASIKENPPEVEAEFYEEYPGYITTVSGPMMSSEKLDELKDSIRSIWEK
jgi:diadenosine tetraphosphate (Ap4A) HIT family hydrolase